eukprot:m.308589 g.308589  ORF g.308589 m.308589 type:complete len:205 (+) comp23029_c0_seq3:495-1109(+)
MEAVQQLLNKSNIVKSVRTYYRRAVDLRSDAEQSNLGLLDSLLDGLQSDGAHTDISWSALGNDHFELSQLRVVFPSPESGIDALLPLIFLDATHLSTSTLKLLIAVGSDALHNLHVLGFSFARQETIAAYTYLLASPQLAVQLVTVMERPWRCSDRMYCTALHPSQREAPPVLLAHGQLGQRIHQEKGRCCAYPRRESPALFLL